MTLICSNLDFSWPFRCVNAFQSLSRCKPVIFVFWRHTVFVLRFRIGCLICTTLGFEITRIVLGICWENSSRKPCFWTKSANDFGVWTSGIVDSATANAENQCFCLRSLQLPKNQKRSSKMKNKNGQNTKTLSQKKLHLRNFQNAIFKRTQKISNPRLFLRSNLFTYVVFFFLETWQF